MSESLNKIASLDVDAQQGFTPLCPHELPVPEGQLIVRELNQQAQWADLRIGTKDAHPRNAIWVADATKPPQTPIKGDHVDVTWPVHCVPGTQGFELIPSLPHPSEYNFFVWKGIEPDMHPYGGCYHDFDAKLSTGLIEFLRINHVTTVLVGGLATEYCVKTTVLQLLQADFKVVLNKAACRGFEPATTELAIKAMQEAGAVIAQSSDELKERIGAL